MQLQQRNYQVILSNNAASTTLVKAYLYLKLSNVFYDEVQLQELIHGAQNHWSNSKTDKKITYALWPHVGSFINYFTKM